MMRFFILISLFLCSSLLQSKQSSSMYQVDVIVFTHQQNQVVESSAKTSLDLNKAPTVSLKPGVGKASYQLLDASASEIRNEFWVLNKKPKYSVLFHYSWLQPDNSQRAVILPRVTHNGWEIAGTMRIRKNNYYLFDTELKLDPIASNHSPFVLTQNQRLKDGVVYYLDHPQAGIIIKIHSVV